MKNYAAWLAEAGFAAERITSVEELEKYSLLVLSGGGDMTPGSGAFQGKVDESRLRYPKPERDELELALLASARERKMPVLGICRGMQVLNVACGGTLWPDISDGGFETAAHTGGTKDTDDVHHWVEMAGTDFEVTSHHHQGVRDLGNELKVISSAEDGMVEAFKHNELPWLGVQWHPERTPDGAGRSLMQEWLRTQC